jgi:hypothetical protein
MNYLTADEVLESRLRGIQEPVEIRDGKGKIMGRYLPVAEKPVDYEKIKNLFDLEEAERIASTESHGYSTEEVKRYLQSLEPKG